MPSPDEVVHALRQFVVRLDQFDPDAPLLGTLSVGVNGAVDTLPLREPVARALVDALLSYHDPRDFGTCAHCLTGRLDRDLVCRGCGAVNGVFGRMLAERAARELHRPDDPPR